MISKTLACISPWIWLVVALWLVGLVTKTTITHGIFGDSNSPLVPYHMIVVFLSCVYMTSSLDRAGFFNYLSFHVLGGARQPLDIFWKNMVLCVVLSVVVSPDVTVMSMTPFMHFFCQSRHIAAMPFLILTLFSTSVYGVRSLASAATFAMTEAYALSQMEYFIWMFAPHTVVLISSYGFIRFLFQVDAASASVQDEEMTLLRGEALEKQPKMENPKKGFALASVLGATTLLMTFGEALCPVWISCLLGASVIAFLHIVNDAKGIKPKSFQQSITEVKLDWAPFVFACFILIECVRERGIIEALAHKLGTKGEIDENAEVSPLRLAFLVVVYAVAAVVGTALVNKNPATIGFCRLLLDKQFIVTTRERWAMSLGVMYGLNVGIYFAPLGSMTVLAWLDILKRKGIYISSAEFSMYGMKCIGIPVLFGIFVLSLQVVVWNPPEIAVHAAPVASPWSGWLMVQPFEAKSAWMDNE